MVVFSFLQGKMPRKGAVITKKINENGNRFEHILYFVCSFFWTRLGLCRKGDNSGCSFI